MKTAKEEWTAEQRRNIEKGMMPGNGKEAYNTLNPLTKIQRHKSADIEDSSGNVLTESTAVLNRETEYRSGLYNYENSIHTLAYFRVTRPPQKRLRAYLR